MASDFDYRFSSEVFDSETGLSYYNYIYYSPELGRWLNKDSIAEHGGYNLYAMVGNDLINNWDMNGTILGFECCDGKWYWQVISCCRD
jgi:RHS repeat-associated protein